MKRIIVIFLPKDRRDLGTEFLRELDDKKKKATRVERFIFDEVVI